MKRLSKKTARRIRGGTHPCIDDGLPAPASDVAAAVSQTGAALCLAFGHHLNP